MLRTIFLQTKCANILNRSLFLSAKFSSDSSNSSNSDDKVTKATETQEKQKLQHVVPKPKGYKTLVQEQTKYNKNTIKNVEQAADLVAQWIGGDVNKTKNDLIKKEKSARNINEVHQKNFKAPTSNERSQDLNTFKSQQTDRRHKVVDYFYDKPKPIKQTIMHVNLFGHKLLGIFQNPNILETKEDSLKTWSALIEHDNQLAITKAPSNYFEKMALWTDEGKVWKFPIDNEQGLDEEAKIPFTDHIFVDEHLENWCPKSGPVRIFMELVCVGLSKNPWYTVEQKKEHIEWYRNYFNEKEDVLKRITLTNENVKTTPSIEQ